MNKTEIVYPHDKLLYFAGAFTAAGLVTALIYTLKSTPYTMILFLGLGQLLLFAGIGVFVAVAIYDIRTRLQSVVEKKFADGAVVFRQGDFPDRLYLIGSGEVDVLRKENPGGEVLLARLGPGEFFGEMGVLGNSPRTATVRARGELEVLSIHRSYFSPLITYLPSLQDRILSEYSRRTEELRNQG